MKFGSVELTKEEAETLLAVSTDPAQAKLKIINKVAAGKASQAEVDLFHNRLAKHKRTDRTKALGPESTEGTREEMAKDLAATEATRNPTQAAKATPAKMRAIARKVFDEAQSAAMACRRMQVLAYTRQLPMVPVKEQAELLGVSEAVVRSDLRHLKDSLTELSEFTAVNEQEMKLMRALEIEMEIKIARAAREASQTDRERRSWTVTLLRWNNALNKFLLDTGMIRRVAAKLELSGPEGGPIEMHREKYQRTLEERYSALMDTGGRN